MACFPGRRGLLLCVPFANALPVRRLPGTRNGASPLSRRAMRRNVFFRLHRKADQRWQGVKALPGKTKQGTVGQAPARSYGSGMPLLPGEPAGRNRSAFHVDAAPAEDGVFLLSGRA